MSIIITSPNTGGRICFSFYTWGNATWYDCMKHAREFRDSDQHVGPWRLATKEELVALGQYLNNTGKYEEIFNFSGYYKDFWSSSEKDDERAYYVGVASNIDSVPQTNWKGNSMETIYVRDL